MVKCWDKPYGKANRDRELERDWRHVSVTSGRAKFRSPTISTKVLFSEYTTGLIPRKFLA
jgi:hypothetical protein